MLPVSCPVLAYFARFLDKICEIHLDELCKSIDFIYTHKRNVFLRIHTELINH